MKHKQLLAYLPLTTQCRHKEPTNVAAACLDLYCFKNCFHEQKDADAEAATLCNIFLLPEIY